MIIMVVLPPGFDANINIASFSHRDAHGHARLSTAAYSQEISHEFQVSPGAAGLLQTFTEVACFPSEQFLSV